MKHITKLISLIVLLLSNSIAIQAADIITAEPIQVTPNDATSKQYISICLDNTTGNLIGFQMDITLPEGISFFKNASGKVVPVKNSARLYNDEEEGITWSITSKLDDEENRLRIVVNNNGNAPILNNKGELIKVRVIADADAKGGNYICKVSNVNFSVKGMDEDLAVSDINEVVRVKGIEDISLLIPEGGYATLCLPYAATLPTGLKAYKATGIKDGMVVLEEQGKIAACTPLVIQGTAGTYNFSGDNSGADEFEYSVGSLKSSLVPAECNQGYVLQNLANGLGFYKIKNALTVPAFRSVLEGTAVNFAPAFVPVGFDEDATAISSVEAAMKNGSAVYTLDGKRVNTMEKGKIYIVGGVKMMVK